MSDTLLRERVGHIEILTLNRPQVRNAINGELARAIDSALTELEAAPGVRVVVLTGAGDLAFSAGTDLKAVAAGEGRAALIGGAGFAGLVRRGFPKPLVCAVNGPALGGGFEIMLACDLAVAAAHATFGLPEASRGMLAGAGGLVRLPRRVPHALAAELALTAAPISSDRALALGLVNEVVPGPEVRAAALALAERVAANGPVAVRCAKRVLTAAAAGTEDDGWNATESALDEVRASADAQEGPRAFAEKRAPVWAGR